MTAQANDMARAGRPHLVDELSEDIDVAIREFLERHPGTSTHRIQQAIRRVERSMAHGRDRRAAAAAALLAALVMGVILGLLIA